MDNNNSNGIGMFVLLIAGGVLVIGFYFGTEMARFSISEVSCQSACDRRAEMMLAQEADVCTCTNTVLRSDYGRMWSE